MKRIFLTSSVGEVAKSISESMSERSLLFITTASEGKSGDLAWLRNHRESLINAGFKVQDFTLTGKTKEEITKAFSETEILCMEGGDTGYLLKKIQETNSAGLIREAIENGKIYIGSSAGSMVCSPDIKLTSDPERVEVWGLTDFSGMNLVDFYLFVHIQRERYIPRLKSWVESFSQMHGEKVIPLQDNQYVYVEGEMYKIVSV